SLGQTAFGMSCRVAYVSKAMSSSVYSYGWLTSSSYQRLASSSCHLLLAALDPAPRTTIRTSRQLLPRSKALLTFDPWVDEALSHAAVANTVWGVKRNLS